MTDRWQQATARPTTEAVITRVLDAPRSLVWKAWTEPERVARWWGPRAFTTPVCKIDLRVGGGYLYCMRSPDDQDFWSRGTYIEIASPERIVATDSFADAEGNVVPSSHYGMDGDWPLEMLVTVTFEDLGGKTRLTIRHADLAAVSSQDRAELEQSWNESVDKLAEHLARPS